eukprot:2419142-Rhodomonas_salina.1
MLRFRCVELPRGEKVQTSEVKRRRGRKRLARGKAGGGSLGKGNVTSSSSFSDGKTMGPQNLTRSTVAMPDIEHRIVWFSPITNAMWRNKSTMLTVTIAAAAVPNIIAVTCCVASQLRNLPFSPPLTHNKVRFDRIKSAQLVGFQRLSYPHFNPWRRLPQTEHKQPSDSRRQPRKERVRQRQSKRMTRHVLHIPSEISSTLPSYLRGTSRRHFGTSAYETLPAFTSKMMQPRHSRHEVECQGVFPNLVYPGYPGTRSAWRFSY